jgi:hypothetical protein
MTIIRLAPSFMLYACRYDDGLDALTQVSSPPTVCQVSSQYVSALSRPFEVAFPILRHKKTPGSLNP